MTTWSDAQLVVRTTDGDRQAFELLVERHQNLVCSVAYSVLGDISLSEDVAQDAFLAAWKQLSQLRDRSKFRAWLCAMTRNLAQKVARRRALVQPLDTADPPVDRGASPEEQAVSREEAALVWNALERLPENYREPLVLYYRAEHSIADVADALEISQDAAKQRLSRGREMLRGEVAAMVERTLRRSAPSKVFTLAVLAALPGIGIGTASAAAATGASQLSGPAASTLSTAGMAGAVAGPLMGLAGGAVGIWAGYRSLQTDEQRAYYKRTMSVWLVVVAIFLLPMTAQGLGLWNPLAQFGRTTYVIGLVSWILGFTVLQLVGILWMSVQLRRMAPAVPTPAATAASQRGQSLSTSWTSQRRLLGLPLIDIQYHAITPWGGTPFSKGAPAARGWIAMGNRAYGVIAIGNFAAGGIAFGGMGIGLFTFAGVGGGLVALCGLGFGGLVLGGAAVGWGAVGGLALGWYAVGGLALAWQGAIGGMAIARNFAVGGLSIAQHANDEVAKAYFDNHTLFKVADTLTKQDGGAFQSRMQPVIVVIVIGSLLLTKWIVARARRQQETKS